MIAAIVWTWGNREIERSIGRRLFPEAALAVEAAMRRLCLP